MTEAIEHNPFSLMKRAAHGDVDAMRDMARVAAWNGREGHSVISAIVGVVFARLAHLRTGSTGDAGLLLALLGVAGDLADDAGLIDEIDGEALAIMSLAEDREGGVVSELVSEAMPALSRESSPEAARIAQAVRRMMLEA